jgi:hypothetical protein
MTARQVDDVRRRLRELKAETLEDMALAAMAFGAALGASEYRHSFAVPFLLGALGLTGLGMRALVRRALLLEDLAGSRDAYVIPDVHKLALRAASPEHRRQLARSLRATLTESSSHEVAARQSCARTEIEELVGALEDDRLSWDPETVVRLERWLNDPAGSFRDGSVAVAELRARLRSVLAGFEGTDPAAR